MNFLTFLFQLLMILQMILQGKNLKDISMTTKPETIFGREIMKNINAQWTRIENRHGGGIPDLYGIRDGTSIWLELKCIKKNSINIYVF